VSKNKEDARKQEKLPSKTCERPLAPSLLITFANNPHHLQFIYSQVDSNFSYLNRQDHLLQKILKSDNKQQPTPQKRAIQIS